MGCAEPSTASLPIRLSRALGRNPDRDQEWSHCRLVSRPVVRLTQGVGRWADERWNCRNQGCSSSDQRRRAIRRTGNGALAGNTVASSYRMNYCFHISCVHVVGLLVVFFDSSLTGGAEVAALEPCTSSRWIKHCCLDRRLSEISRGTTHAGIRAPKEKASAAIWTSLSWTFPGGCPRP